MKTVMKQFSDENETEDDSNIEEVIDKVYSMKINDSIKESSRFLLIGFVLFPIAIFVGAIIHSFIHFLTWR